MCKIFCYCLCFPYTNTKLFSERLLVVWFFNKRITSVQELHSFGYKSAFAMYSKYFSRL